MPLIPNAKLKFKVAPHIVEDLGLNLYTTLPRVLVEFVANAYDADSSFVNIKLDHERIKKAREVVKKQYELDKANHQSEGGAVAPLETRTLPGDLQIVIEDGGFGMSRDDLNEKFLFAGRRRRSEEPAAKGRTPKGRPIMGRKGLGKLAGFGVAKLVEVVTRKAGENHATKVTLDYSELVKKQSVHEIEVPDETIVNGAGIKPSGTRIVLSRLLYDPLKSRARTIQEEIADYFAQIDPADFVIRLNDNPIRPATRNLAFAWPEPDSVLIEQFIEKSLPREGGGEIKFAYRIRFTAPNEALEAEQRGVRVYAHKRLAASPSLLGADTNMHGFRMTDYMDGVVHADFIDEEEADYIATDRGSLRWESPLLSGMFDFLSNEIKEACKQYQKRRDEQSPNIVKKDAFTVAEISKYDLSKKDRRMALRFAVILEKSCKRGVDDPVYQSTLPPLVKGIGHGNVLSAITVLADQRHPNLDNVVREMVRLTKDEFDLFIGAVKGRLKGVEALKKIVEHVDFRAKRNERRIQELFERCPWMVDPTYTQFLTADVSLGTVFKRLAQELGIGQYASSSNNGKEPDLVFLIGNTSLCRLVIVELKASNIELESDHLGQLEYYMQRAEEWLEEQNCHGFQVHGHLIGTKASPKSRAQGTVILRRRIKESGPDTPWRVRDYMDVLRDTQAAHEELLDIYHRIEKAAAEDDED
ncbi:MAG: ATP-binding protein [Pirellulales bacterium]|nr:ATP-binding protein [Pirellulales bacterium]